MRWKKEIFKAANSLVLLGMAIWVGMYAASHFLSVVERRTQAAAPVFANMHLHERTIIPPEKKIAALFQKDARETFAIVRETLWGIAPASALFLCVYFLVNRLATKLITAAGP